MKDCVAMPMLVTCKVLRTGEKSRLMSSRNPWMMGMHAILIEYQSLLDDKANMQMNRRPMNRHSNIYHKSYLDKEIQLVLKNRKGVPKPARVSTIFTDYINGNHENNKELNYILKKIHTRPYISVPRTKNTKEHNDNKEEAEKIDEQEIRNMNKLEFKDVS